MGLEESRQIRKNRTPKRKKKEKSKKKDKRREAFIREKLLVEEEWVEDDEVIIASRRAPTKQYSLDLCRESVFGCLEKQGHLKSNQMVYDGWFK